MDDKKDLILNKKILLVDDEMQLCHMVSGILLKAGFHQVRSVGSVSEAMVIFRQWQPDVLILDVMLPDGSGFSLFETLREISYVPVLFLSARDEDENRLTGLGLGADDYITKPFLPKELVLRLSAVLRRSYAVQKPENHTHTHLGNTCIDWGSGEVIRNDTSVTLTAKEYALLKKLYENRGNIVTIDALSLAVWGDDDEIGYENTLMVHIRRLREKIEENPSHPKWLVTVRGLGYKLERSIADEG